MRRKIYDKQPEIRFILANWPENELTYKQLYAYGQKAGLDITSDDIKKVVKDLKHVGLVETKMMSGTVRVTILDELREYKRVTDLGVPIPTQESIKGISPYLSPSERKVKPLDPPKMKYTFAVRCVIASIKPGVQFTYHDIRKTLEKRGITPGGKTNQIQPYTSYLFLKKNLLDRIHRGKPTIYRTTQAFFDYFRPERNTMIASFPEWKSHFEINFQEPEPEPEPSVREVAEARRTEAEPKPETEEDVLPEGITPADFGAAMFDYMLELRNGNGVEEVQRLRAKLEDSQLAVHNLRLEIAKQKSVITKLNETKTRDEDTIKELTTALNASRNEAALAQNRKRTFTMQDVAVIKGQKDDTEPSNGVAFKFGT